MNRDYDSLKDQLVSACWRLCSYWFFLYLLLYCLVYVVVFLLIFFLSMYFPETIEFYLSSAVVQSVIVLFSIVCDVFFWCFSFYLSFSYVLKRSDVIHSFLSKK